MFKRYFAAAALFLTALAAPTSAQINPWPTRDWVAVCSLDERHGPGATITYTPEPGIYCRFDNYAYRNADGRLVSISVRQSDVDEALSYARYASHIYEDWGLTAPALPIEDSPVGTPMRFGSGEGYVMNIVPEVFLINDPSNDRAAGVFFPPSPDDPLFTSQLESEPGRLAVQFQPRANALLSGETGPDAERLNTVAHELAHAIQWAYLLQSRIDAVWDEFWVTEGVADALANTIDRLYEETGLEIPSFSATSGRLTGWARLTGGTADDRRYTAFNGGLFTTDGRAIYDTSSFWEHLFISQINDLSEVNEMYLAAESADTGARYVIDDWLQDDRGLSLPEAYRRFLRDVIRDGSFYDGAREDSFLGCSPHTVTLSATAGGSTVYEHERPVREDQRDALDGMRAACIDYEIDASRGPVTVSLAPSFGSGDEAVEPSPHLQLLAGNAILNEGENLVIPAGETRTLRTVAFFSPLGRAVSAEDLILRGFAVRFEQSSQSLCNTQTVALNGIATIETPLGHGAGREANLPQFGEASVEARFGERVVSGPACARLILLDYGGPEGPALTFQLVHNPSNSYWHNRATQNFTGNWVNINVHIPSSDFVRSDFASGREVVFDQTIVIDDQASAIVTNWDQYRLQAGYTFVSNFANAWGRDSFSTSGHPQNENITLTFTDVGQDTASGTFTYSTLGPSNAEFNDVFVTSTATGTFTAPIERMGPRDDIAAWTEDCQIALMEGRAFDMTLCARALPQGRGEQIINTFRIYWDWYYSTFLQ